MEYYDLIISLGQDCSVAGSLRNLKYKNASYPFDWNVTSLNFVLKSFETKFTTFICDWNEYVPSQKGHIKEKNNSIEFSHDSSFKDLQLNIQSKRKFVEKYKRRCDRINTILNEKKRILFVRKGQFDSVSQLSDLKNIIKRNYPTIIFKILLINNIKETSDDDDIIHIFKKEICFLEYKNDIYRHRSAKIAYNSIYEEISKFKSKKFDQPKYRDNI